MSNATTQRRLSSRNPFRTPSLTPNPTGTSTTSTVPSYHSALPISHTLLIPIPTGMSTTSNAPSYHTAVESNVHSNDEDTPEILPELTPRILSRNLSDLTLDDIPEVPPPAYTLTPDIDGGEASMQDPIEPFQPVPEPSVQAPPPPPSPPSSFHERPLSPLSEFEVPPSPTAPLQQQQPHYAPPPGPPPPAASVRQQPRYGPPPGAPPLDRPRAASTSSSAGSTSPPASNGHPTSIPTPGRPLLRNGRTLIYPESFLCHKCKPRCPTNFLSHWHFLTRSWCLFICTHLYRPKHGLQELRPVAPVSQVLGPLWQAVHSHTRFEPVGRPEQQLRESEWSHISTATSLV